MLCCLKIKPKPVHKLITHTMQGSRLHAIIMASARAPNMHYSFIFVMGFSAAWVVASFAGGVAAAAAEGRRAFFVFGDSLVDNGNNNYLATTARADWPPYGIDHPTHLPTGRFSNGLSIPDIISEKLGTEPVLPYLNPELDGEKLVVGANFASAGVGILDDTGIQFVIGGLLANGYTLHFLRLLRRASSFINHRPTYIVNIIRIHQQLDYFAEYQERLKALVGAKNGTELVQDALVLISLGGNDFVNNYFLVPFSARSRQYALPDYVVFIISEYKKVLKRLYNLGARKVIVTGTGPMGCAPAEMAQHSIDGDCASELQRAASLYNPRLLQMVEAINNDIGYDVFVTANAHKMHMDFITSPQTFGFVTSHVACCGQGPYNGLGFCTPLSNLCSNREEYAFWDAFHPSEKANRIIVDQMMVGSNDYMHPMNLSTILTMV